MGSKQQNLQVKVLNEKEVLYYGECNSLSAPTESGVVTILPFHTPLIAKLGEGKVTAQVEHEKIEIASLERGLIYVGENEVVVLIGL